MYEYESIDVKPKEWRYDKVVSILVRAHYSEDDVEAIILNNNDDELDELNNWRDYVKSFVSKLFGISDTLDGAKKEKIRALNAYDKSSAVNEFTFNSINMWISLEKRKDMRTSISSLKAMSVKEWTYWYNGVPITMPVSQFEDMLNAVEVYAIQCYNVTAQHASNISALESVEEVLEYDYSIGYPEKLNFN